MNNLAVLAEIEKFLAQAVGTRYQPDMTPEVAQRLKDALAHVDFELDFANNKLNLYSQDHCPGAVVYWTDNYSSAQITRGPQGNYYFPMELEGKKIEATISTVDQSTWLSTEVTRSLYGFDEKSEGTETEKDTAGHRLSHFRAMALTGSGISIKNAQVDLDTTAAGKGCYLATRGQDDAAEYRGCMGLEAPLKIGLNVARKLHLYFATKERVLYFSDATASK